MSPKYEEKTYESYFNSELDRRSSVHFPFGQVQEGGIGADAAGFSRSYWLWQKLGYPFLPSLRYRGVSLLDLAKEMEFILTRQIKGIPAIKVNLLFQYKRPSWMVSKSATEWPHWRQKYFRYDIDSNQQKLLAQIDSKFGKDVLVLYAAPAIIDVNELVEMQQQDRIIEATNFTLATKLKGHHRNTYISAGTHSIACSEPQRIECFDLLNHLEKLRVNESMSNHDLILRFVTDVRTIGLDNREFGNAFRILLKPFEEVSSTEFPIFFSMISMAIFRELSGLQWLISTDKDSE